MSYIYLHSYFIYCYHVFLFSPWDVLFPMKITIIIQKTLPHWAKSWVTWVLGVDVLLCCIRQDKLSCSFDIWNRIYIFHSLKYFLWKSYILLYPTYMMVNPILPHSCHNIGQRFVYSKHAGCHVSLPLISSQHPIRNDFTNQVW